MMDHFNKQRAERALKDVLSPDVSAAVVALHRDDGQVTIYNMGDSEGRGAIYSTLAALDDMKVRDFNARMTLCPRCKEGGSV